MKETNPFTFIAGMPKRNANIGWTEKILTLMRLFLIICHKKIKDRSEKLFMIISNTLRNNGMSFNGGDNYG